MRNQSAKCNYFQYMLIAFVGEYVTLKHIKLSLRVIGESSHLLFSQPTREGICILLFYLGKWVTISQHTIATFHFIDYLWSYCYTRYNCYPHYITDYTYCFLTNFWYKKNLVYWYVLNAKVNIVISLAVKTVFMVRADSCSSFFGW